MYLAKFLKKARLKNGYSQRDISIALGFTSAQFISNWERGLATPPPKYFISISTIYSVSPNKLINLYLKDLKENIKREAGLYENVN